MSNYSVLFEGSVRIYLQGNNALQVIPATNLAEEMHYYIGNESTQFLIHDFRKKTVKEAQEAIQRQYQNGFAKSFNQTAWAIVKYDELNEGIDIEIRDNLNASTKKTILWMGILENNLMPGYEVAWEVFKSLDAQNTAFVALIDQAT